MKEPVKVFLVTDRYSKFTYNVTGLVIVNGLHITHAMDVGGSAKAKFELYPADVVLIDVHWPDGIATNFHELLYHFKSVDNSIKVIGITRVYEERTAASLAYAGADGYVHGNNIEKMAQRVRAVYKNKKQFEELK